MISTNEDKTKLLLEYIDRITNQTEENHKLRQIILGNGEEIEKLKLQIDQMKCCTNCKYNSSTRCLLCRNLNKWKWEGA